MKTVHEAFVRKPGKTSKLLKIFKKSMAASNHMMHIVTDMAGQYNEIAGRKIRNLSPAPKIKHA